MLILAAILAIFVYGMIAATLGTILPNLSSIFHLSPEQNSYIALAQGLGLTVASISVGPLIDNKGKKLGLSLGLGLVVIALFALPNASGYGMIIGTMFLLGLGGGIIVTGANALASDISESKRGAVMNFLNLFFGLGGFATPFVAANILGGDSFKLSYTMAVTTAVTLLFALIAPIPPPSKDRAIGSGESGKLFGNPALYLLAAFLFLYVACEVGVWNWLARHLISQGIPEKSALNILGLGFALGLLFGRMAVSPILIKVPAATVTLGSAVLMAITTYAMLQTTDPMMAGALVFCTGVAMAPVFPTTLAIVGNVFPKGTATAMGFAITMGWVGLVISSPIIGAIAGDDPKALKTALLVLPVCSVVMIGVNLALRPLLAKKAA